MAVLPTGFGKSIPFRNSTTNKNNEWENDRMQSTSASGLIALMQDQEKGMSKYQIWKQLMQIINTLSYLIIITYSRFTKEEPVIFLQDFIQFMALNSLYKKQRNKKMKYVENNYKRPYIIRYFSVPFKSIERDLLTVLYMCISNNIKSCTLTAIHFI